MDYYLEQAIEAKTKGAPIPLTTNLAIKSFENMIALHKHNEALQSRLDAMEAQIKQANDPQAPINNMAYATMETFLQSAVEGMYGNAPQGEGVRRSIHDAAVNLITANLKELQAKAPGTWDRVRRNQGELQKLVNAAIRQIVPPKAMELMEHDTLVNTEMSVGELRQAFEEAKAIKNPLERRQLMTQIRQDILAQTIAPQKGGPGRRR